MAELQEVFDMQTLSSSDRRKLRIQQVRAQEKVAAAAVRARFAAQSESEKNKILSEIEADWRKSLAVEQERIQREYAELVNQFGQGHVSALLDQTASDRSAASEDARAARYKATRRGKDALRRLKIESLEQEAAQNQRGDRLKHVRKREQQRAAEVAAAGRIASKDKKPSPPDEPQPAVQSYAHTFYHQNPTQPVEFTVEKQDVDVGAAASAERAELEKSAQLEKSRSAQQASVRMIRSRGQAAAKQVKLKKAKDELEAKLEAAQFKELDRRRRILNERPHQLVEERECDAREKKRQVQLEKATEAVLYRAQTKSVFELTKDRLEAEASASDGTTPPANSRLSRDVYAKDEEKKLEVKRAQPISSLRMTVFSKPEIKAPAPRPLSASPSSAAAATSASSCASPSSATSAASPLQSGQLERKADVLLSPASTPSSLQQTTPREDDKAQQTAARRRLLSSPQRTEGLSQRSASSDDLPASILKRDRDSDRGSVQAPRVHFSERVTTTYHAPFADVEPGWTVLDTAYTLDSNNERIKVKSSHAADSHTPNHTTDAAATHQSGPPHASAPSLGDQIAISLRRFASHPEPVAEPSARAAAAQESKSKPAETENDKAVFYRTSESASQQVSNTPPAHELDQAWYNLLFDSKQPQTQRPAQPHPSTSAAPAPSLPSPSPAIQKLRRQVDTLIAEAMETAQHRALQSPGRSPARTGAGKDSKDKVKLKAKEATSPPKTSARAPLQAAALPTIRKPVKHSILSDTASTSTLHVPTAIQHMQEAGGIHPGHDIPLRSNAWLNEPIRKFVHFE